MLYAVFRGHIFLSISERSESIVNLVNVYQNLSMATCNALVLVGARSPTTTTTVVVQQSANAVETFLFLRFPPGGTSASQNWAYDTSTVTGMINLYTIEEFYITSHARTQIWYMSCTTPGIYDCRLTYDTKDSFCSSESVCYVLCTSSSCKNTIAQTFRSKLDLNLAGYIRVLLTEGFPSWGTTSTRSALECDTTTLVPGTS